MSHAKGTAVVTGASRGIGAVYAERLAKRGYDLGEPLSFGDLRVAMAGDLPSNPS